MSRGQTVWARLCGPTCSFLALLARESYKLRMKTQLKDLGWWKKGVVRDLRIGEGVENGFSWPPIQWEECIPNLIATNQGSGYILSPLNQMGVKHQACLIAVQNNQRTLVGHNKCPGEAVFPTEIMTLLPNGRHRVSRGHQQEEFYQDRQLSPESLFTHICLRFSHLRTLTVSKFNNPEQDTGYLKFLKVPREKYLEISQRKMWS